MVDGLTPHQDPMQDPPTSSAIEEGGPKGFLASSAGRIVVIVGALAVLVAIVLAVVVYSPLQELVFGEKDATTSPAPAPSNAATTTPAATAPAAVVPVEPRPASLNSVYTFRDVFISLLPEESADSGSGSTDGTSTSSPDVSEDTLYLEDIVIVDGIPYAYLIWNGEEYVLAEGEGIPGTPWQVLEIREDSVVMLYGDSQVVLTIGQGVGK